MGFYIDDIEWGDMRYASILICIHMPMGHNEEGQIKSILDQDGNRNQAKCCSLVRMAVTQLCRSHFGNYGAKT